MLSASPVTAATTILAFLAALAGLIAPAGQSDEASAKGSARGCDRVADPSGSDTSPGTVGRPFESVRRLVASLDPGETGCLRAGSYDSPEANAAQVPPLPCVIPPCDPGGGGGGDGGGASDQGSPAQPGYFELRLRTPRITLASFPGERATIVGRMWVGEEAAGSVIRDLDLVGTSTGSNTTLVLNAKNVTLRRNDITSNSTDTCVAMTTFHGVRPNGFRIIANRIHDCGQRPATNQEHGIYVSSGRDGVIRDNLIYDNADRGVQLYPNADSTRVSQNYIVGNGQGVNIGGNTVDVSSGNIVQDNLIADSTLRWNVESSWSGSVGRGNRIRGNCLRASSSNPYYNLNGGISPQEPLGFVIGQNVLAPPAPEGAAPGADPIECGG